MQVLITGASGKLGSYLLGELQDSQHAVTAWSGRYRGECLGFALEPVDLTDAPRVAAAFRKCQPDVVLHTAAESGVAACYDDPDLAHQTNVLATRLLAELAAEGGARLIFVSTDMVFDGRQGPYGEDDPVCPLSTYGKSKAAAEPEVLKHAQHAVVRVSLMFGPTLVDRPSFFDHVLGGLRQGKQVRLFHDEWRTPLSLRTAAQQLLAAMHADLRGLWHLGGPERLSRFEMGQRLATHLGLPTDNLVSTELDSVTAPEPRPRDLSFDSSRWRASFPGVVPQYEEALREMGLSK